jgi:tetratricopeptide (TPR) repeat protein
MSKQEIACWIQRGRTLYEQGKYEEALSALEQAIAKDPFNISAQKGKGATLAQLGRYEEAITVFEHLMALAPDDVHPYESKAFALQHLGRSQEALAFCQQPSVRGQDQTAAAYELSGCLCWRLGYREEALGTYEQAILLDPDMALAHHGRGNVLREVGRADEALAAYERASQLDPGLAPAHNGRGFMLQTLGRYHEALEAYEQAIECDPGFAFAWQNRYRVLALLGQPHRTKTPTAYLPLEQRLLVLGGRRMVPRYEPDLEPLLRRGEIFDEPVGFVPEEPHECHSNVAQLWNKQRTTVAIVTGYALSEDGFWRQHSWLVRKYPKIGQARLLETTTRRVKYFGFVLTNDEAEQFLAMNG